MELLIGAYDYELPSDAYKEKLSNMIKAAKRNCTMLDRKSKEEVESAMSYRGTPRLSQSDSEAKKIPGIANPKIMDRLPMIKTSYINQL